MWHKRVKFSDSLTVYFFSFHIYTRKVDNNQPGHGLSYQVVFDLMLRHFLDKGYCLFTENFYTHYKVLSSFRRRADHRKLNFL